MRLKLYRLTRYGRNFLATIVAHAGDLRIINFSVSLLNVNELSEDP